MARLTHNTCIHFYKLNRKHVKTNSVFCVKCIQKFKYFFFIWPTKLFKWCNWEHLIFEDATVKSVHSFSSIRNFIVTSKKTFSRCLFGNIYVIWVEYLSQHWVSVIVSVSDFKIISSSLIWPSVIMALICKKRFCYAPKMFIPGNTVFRSIIKIFLSTFLCKTYPFVSLYFVFFSFSLVRFFENYFLTYFY